MSFWKKILTISPFPGLILASFFSWKPLLSAGFFPIHDNQQIARLFELDKALQGGQFPVRWVSDLGFGFGYPLFNFYPPQVYYLGEIFHLVLGAGYIDSIKLVWFVALIGSALAMYFLSKEWFGRIGGAVSALFYLYAPYHALDAYVRGSLAELFSFVWLPLILLFAYKTVKEGKLKYSLWTGITLALLMLTHNLIFLPFFPILIIWYFSLALIYQREKFLRNTLYFALSTLLCFGLTAFFWLPSLVEKQYTLVDQLLIKNLASYQIHFVCPAQLWNSPWGFGGSTAGCIDGLSFKIGKIHALLSLLSIPLICYFWLSKNRILSLKIFLTAFLLLFSIFMTIPASVLIWDNLKVLWYLQFPWRFLEFVALFTSILSACIFLLIKNQNLKIILATAMIAVLLFYEAKNFKPQLFLTSATDQTETSDEQIKWVVSSTSFEYLPKGVATKLTDLGAVWVDIDRSKVPATKFQTLSGDFQVSAEKFLSDHFLLTGFSKEGTIIQINTTNFPGWKIWLNGKEIQINDNNPYKLITAFLPAGENALSGKFTDTPIRIAGNFISIIFIFITGAFIYYGTGRNFK